jgi:hypothetical protein
MFGYVSDKSSIPEDERENRPIVKTCVAIRNHPYFQGFIYLMIIFVALQIGMETDNVEVPMASLMNTVVIFSFTFEVRPVSRDGRRRMSVVAS